ncbi:MAG: hypothetical protein AB1545_16590 [Thermodesulfobacteriota bacterium]
MNRTKNIHEELAVALAEFAAMQRHHGSLLAEGRLKTLPEWARSREQAFLRLQQCLARFDPTMLDGQSECAVQLRELMEVIIKDERSLKMQVQSQQGKIREKLQTLRRGKAVLKGYSLHHGAGPKPKYLSSKA